MQLNLSVMPYEVVRWLVIEYIKHTDDEVFSVLSYATLTKDEMCKIGSIVKTSLINEVQDCKSTTELNAILGRTTVHFPGMMQLGWYVCEWWKRQLNLHDIETLKNLYDMPDNLIEQIKM